MPDPKPIEGGRALLFDRLINDRPTVFATPKHQHILPLEALKKSVRQELERLLNTRCAVPLEQLGGEERSVINYGLPDFSSCSPHSSHDRKLLGALIVQTISAFEPRLRQVRVIFEQFVETRQAVRIRIEALLVADTHTEPVFFPVLGRTRHGDWEVHECERSGGLPPLLPK